MGGMAGQDFSPEQLAATFKHFIDAVAAQASAQTSPLLDRIRAHLGGDPAELPVIAEEFDSFEHPNVQVALDAYLAEPGRRAELVGIAAANKRFMGMSLSDFMSRSFSVQMALAEGPVDYVNFHLAGDQVLSCVQFGLYLVTGADARLVVFVAGPSGQGGPRVRLRVEVMATRREDCQAFHKELGAAMRRLNVYRGHTIALAAGPMIGMGPQSLVEFRTLPSIERDDIILPAGVLERIEDHTVVFAEHSAELLAHGRSLKRGLLLYGLPGTGKTLTVMHLSGRMKDRTVILTTARGMGLVQTIGQMARMLAPSMVVIEDVDLIAEQRGQGFFMPTGPLLFELLNEMDGLRDDHDVIFVLTTNRPDILEPALAARPGRIDLAVELPLPDAQGRLRLFELYARGLTLEGVDFTRFVAKTEGVSPAYIKELLRKAALHAALEGPQTPVRDAHLTAAMEELSEGGRLAERILGFRPGQEPVPGQASARQVALQTGFPAPFRAEGR